MKKLFSLLLVCALAFTMSVSAFAAEAAPSTEKEPPAQTEVDATTRAEDIPTESAALPYYATVVNLCEGCGTYTRYYFNTTSGKLTIGGTLNSSGDENNKSRNAKIELYEVNKSGAIDSYTVSQFTESTSLSHTFRNLSANKNYYIRIVNTTGWAMASAFAPRRWHSFMAAMVSAVSPDWDRTMSSVCPSIRGSA